MYHETLLKLPFTDGYYCFKEKVFVPEQVDCMARVPYAFPNAGLVRDKPTRGDKGVTKRESRKKAIGGKSEAKRRLECLHFEKHRATPRSHVSVE